MLFRSGGNAHLSTHVAQLPLPQISQKWCQIGMRTSQPVGQDIARPGSRAWFCCYMVVCVVAQEFEVLYMLLNQKQDVLFDALELGYLSSLPCFGSAGCTGITPFVMDCLSRPVKGITGCVRQCKQKATSHPVTCCEQCST